MARVHPLGERREGRPIPPVPEATKYYQHGRLKVGIEHRFLNGAVIKEFLEGDDDQQAIMRTKEKQYGFSVSDLDGEATSIHVFDAETGIEHLRFDGFADDPHYHYMLPSGEHLAVAFDDIADNSDFIEWALKRMETRLPEMLEYASASELAGEVDQAQFNATVLPHLHQVIDIIRSQIIKSEAAHN